MGGSYTLLWAWVMRSSRERVGYEEITEGLELLRRRLFSVIVLAALVVFLGTQAILPYQPVRDVTVGQPAIVINATTSQFAFTLSNTTIPAHVPVEFAVTSLDVNHGFGIFDPDGRIIAQTQSMPGYTNRLIVNFTRTGQYRIHCLEYCGVDHWGMEAFFDVV
ncbi:MAG: cytochrome c oxidase subunit II [Methanomicrobiales archaeon]|nr:cytochrome c oxidase subunit II [Methanomicrobiales archaeon]